MNTIVIAAFAAWLFAQLAKICIGFLRYGSNEKRRILWRMIWAGGMPSAHSAVIAASAFTVLRASGSQSALFGLSLVMACIVIYDRSRMYAIYCTFQMRYPELKQAVQNDPLLKDLVGHRFSEIVTGVIIGLVAGCIMVSIC